MAVAELIALVAGGCEAKPKAEASRGALRLGLGEDDAEAATETRVLGGRSGAERRDSGLAVAQMSALGQSCKAEGEMEGSRDSLRLGLGEKEGEVVACRGGA